MIEEHEITGAPNAEKTQNVTKTGDTGAQNGDFSTKNAPKGSEPSPMDCVTKTSDMGGKVDDAPIKNIPKNGAPSQASHVAKEGETGAENDDASTAEQAEQTVARKPFRITEFDAPKDREMAVFTHAKKLSEYIFVITEKSPVKYRWNIVSRLLDTSVEIIEYLYRANYERGEERLTFQKKAMTALNLLDFYAETAKTKMAITFRQMMIIARQISEVKKLLSGWVRSTKKSDAYKNADRGS